MINLTEIIKEDDYIPTTLKMVAKELKSLRCFDSQEIEELANFLLSLDIKYAGLEDTIEQLNYDIEEKDQEIDAIHAYYEEKEIENRDVCDLIAEKVNVYNQPLLETVVDQLQQRGHYLRQTA